MAAACCSLRANSRWVVTGTPLQNRLTDLLTLFRFIRVQPYDQPHTFKTYIADELGAGNKDLGMLRLKYLLRCVMLVRPKTTIELPPRDDAICPVSLSQDEQSWYDEHRDKASKTIEMALNTSSTSSESYFNALQQINALRMICNLGVHYTASNLNPSKENLPHQVWNYQNAQECFNNMATLGGMVCSRCQVSVETLFEQLSSLVRKDCAQAQMFRCHQMFCGPCFQSMSGMVINTSICGHWPQCAVAPISLNIDTGTVKYDVPTVSVTRALPTKIAELIRQLKNNAPGTKRLISLVRQ